jgi:outer membrane cobalamin receptor
MTSGIPLMLAAALRAFPLDAAPAPVLADSACAYALPPIEIVGARFPGHMLVPFAMSVRRADVEGAEGAADATALLRGVPGLDLRRSGGPGSPAAASLRGSSPEQVAVFVDGVPAATSQGGGADLSLLPAFGVGSAEIIRGSGAALWGGHGLSGAVHLASPPAIRSEVRVSLETASFAGRAAGVSLTSAAGRADLAVRLSTARGAGDFRYDDGRQAGRVKRENGGFGRDHVDLSLRSAKGGRSLEGAVSVVSAHRGMPGTVEYPSESAEQDDRQVRARVGSAPARRAGAQGAAADGLRWDLLFLDHWRRYRDAGSPWGPMDERHQGRRALADFAWSGSRPGASLTATLSPSWETLQSTTDGSRERPSMSAAVRVERDLPVHRRAGASGRGAVAVSLRADAVRSFGTVVDPAVGVSAPVIPGFLDASVTASVTHRIPSFDDLFWPASAFAAGNPDLRPESARGVDAGLRLSAGSARASAGVFASEIRDLIQWAPSGGGRWTPHNVSRATWLGAEAEAEASRPLGRRWIARASASGTLLDASERGGGPATAGRQLPRRPRAWGSASVAAERGAWSLRVEAEGVSRRYLNASNTKWIAPHGTVTVRARAPVAPAFWLDAEIANVADAAYVDVSDVPIPGRTWSLRVAYAHGIGRGRE